MNIKFIFSLCILFLYFPLNAQSKLKKITEVKYKVDSITDIATQKDTLCDMLGCYNVRMYNSKGKQTDLISYDKKNKVVFRSSLSYLKNGDVEEVQSFNDRDEMTFNDKYIYENNKLSRIENYQGNKVLNYYEKFSYDKNKLIGIEKYQRDDKMMTKEEIKNDKTIKLTEYGHYGFSTIVYTYEYNKAKLLVRKKTSRIGEDE